MSQYEAAMLHQVSQELKAILERVETIERFLRAHTRYEEAVEQSQEYFDRYIAGDRCS